MLKAIAGKLIGRAERRLGVGLDYVRHIAATDIGLLSRYNRFFSFLDGNRHVPPAAYHTARIRGALTADCGACVEIEVNLARTAGLTPALINNALDGRSEDAAIAAVIALCDAVVRDRMDDADARETIRAAWGEPALSELAYAMNGAAMVPGIMRAMGYATACDATLMERLRKGQ